MAKTQPQNKDYICSTAKDNGMTQCHVDSNPELHLPHFKNGTVQCNSTAAPNTWAPSHVGTNETVEEGTCVNWNQYYTKCAPDSSNPYQGSISFDNIGLAWVAIFQVCIVYSELHLFIVLIFFCFLHFGCFHGVWICKEKKENNGSRLNI